MPNIAEKQLETALAAFALPRSPPAAAVPDLKIWFCDQLPPAADIDALNPSLKDSQAARACIAPRRLVAARCWRPWSARWRTFSGPLARIPVAEAFRHGISDRSPDVADVLADGANLASVVDLTRARIPQRIRQGSKGQASC